MSALEHSLIDVWKHYRIEIIRNSEGSTPEEIYDSMDLLGVEKPPREEFIAKVNENIPKYLLEELRVKRNKLLVESDWTQFRDVVLADDEAWKTYRQALRDLPSQVEPKLNEDMDALFPTKPNA
jgi:hypothetical protein